MKCRKKRFNCYKVTIIISKLLKIHFINSAGFGGNALFAAIELRLLDQFQRTGYLHGVLKNQN